MVSYDDVLTFWFGTNDLTKQLAPRRAWFAKDAEFDRTIAERFGTLLEEAGRGEHDAWRKSPASCLALLLLLDQFSRNVYRGTARAFANDPAAMQHCLYALDHGHDRQVAPVARWFFYMPLEHCESIERQRDAVARFKALEGSPSASVVIGFAEKHMHIVERFGRFPHRNATLGRESTPEEVEFLNQDGAGF
ncbi:DUF924 domain-containing protein [Pendulispora rubella]|uniref:DUF924 domain-containing protein n=1 Tax=Pendulispora rubella TaxID=2741070 RepID=A0ABZ2L9D2_9BACT